MAVAVARAISRYVAAAAPVAVTGTGDSFDATEIKFH